MDDLQQTLFILSEHYQSMSARYQKELLTLPSGTLQLHSTRGKKYYVHLENGKSRYLSLRKDKALLQALSRKRFIKKSLTIINSNLRQLSQLSRRYVPLDTVSADKGLFPLSHSQIHNACSTNDSPEVAAWLAMPVIPNPHSPEKKIHLTSGGEYVRSKSELVIANALFAHNIPYKYEPQLILGNATLHPDFEIFHPLLHRIFYWEHFGLLSNPQYERNMNVKLQLYRQHDIVLWHNLFITFDSPEGALDSRQIDAIIAAFLLK